MNAYPLYALGLQASSDLERSIRPAASAEPDLDGDWNLGDVETSTNHLDHPVGVPEQSRAGVIAAYLWSGAAEVDVNDIGPVLQQFDGLDHLRGDTAEDLRNEWFLSRVALYLEP